MSKKQIFEIPDDPGSVVFQPGREISIDGRTIVEIELASACSRHLMTDGARAYCEKHRFNPVFVYSPGNLPVLIGFVFDEKSSDSFSRIPLTALLDTRRVAPCIPA
jgi:hypothetical protein